MAEKSSNVMKAINPHIQESEGTPSTRNMKKTNIKAYHNHIA